eukprot:scaffold324967_cov40-Prasinocladus_malaysianus.AAC.2
MAGFLGVCSSSSRLVLLGGRHRAAAEPEGLADEGEAGGVDVQQARQGSQPVGRVEGPVRKRDSEGHAGVGRDREQRNRDPLHESLQFAGPVGRLQPPQDHPHVGQLAHEGRTEERDLYVPVYGTAEQQQ